MKKTIAILLALLLCLTSAGAWAEETDLKVTGTGIISVLADQMSVTLGATETNEDVKTAQETVNAKINAIYEALIAAGVEKKNIGTDRISINVEYSRYGDKVTGYTASNTITVQSRDIDQVGAYDRFGAGHAGGQRCSGDGNRKLQLRRVCLRCENDEFPPGTGGCGHSAACGDAAGAGAGGN